MSMKIKDEYFNKILVDIENYKLGFDWEGCACGRLEIELSEELYLSVYQSCRKSSNTPDNKLWHIDDIEFYKKPYQEFEYPDEPIPLNLKLNETQESKLIDLLKRNTTEIWGEEYR